MTHALRPYQQQAIERLRAAVRAGARRVLLVSPTGSGKTVIATAIAAGHVATPQRRVLFLAHRAELVTQAAVQLNRVGDVRRIQAAADTGRDDAPIVVASLQTLAATRFSGKPIPGITMILIDEAHHGPADQWGRVCADYPTQLRIGLTATPVRSDGRPLGDVFETIVQVATIRELTDAGYLAPCRVLAPPSRQRGIAELPESVYLESIAPHDSAESPRRTVIFCDQLRSAERCESALLAAGIRCGIVHGTLPPATRAHRLGRFSRGDDRVLINVSLLTEGWDDPSVTDCILARSCASAGLYLQIVGRILRIAKGKTGAILWDLTGAVHEHGLPDADREYSLDGEPIRLSEEEQLSLAQCLQCGVCVRRPANGLCPACGAPLGAKREPIEVRRARLAEVSAAHTPEQRDAYLQDLLRIARERGYASGWAYHRMRARYGEKEDGS